MQSVRDSENRLKWRDSLLYRLADALYRAGELFRMVIDAIIDLAKSAFGSKGEHGDIFTNEEAAGIKDIIDEYAKSKDERFAVSNWLVNFACVKGKFTDAQIDRAFSEVDDVAEGRYNGRIDRGRGGISI